MKNVLEILCIPMPRKIKLTNEQKKREDAINEVEAFFNTKQSRKSVKSVKSKVIKSDRASLNEQSHGLKDEVKTRPMKKGRVIAVKNKVDTSSPYLVNLGIVKKVEVEKIAEINDDDLKKFSIFDDRKESGGERVNIIKGEFYTKNTIKEIDEFFRKFFSFILKIIKIFFSPITKLVDIIDKGIKNFYFSREEVLRELLVVNVLMLIISTIKSLVKVAKRGLFAVLIIFYRVFILAVALVLNLVNLTILTSRLVRKIFKKIKNILTESASKGYKQGFSAIKTTIRLGNKFLKTVKNIGISISKEIKFLAKKLFLYILYPVVALYSNTKKYSHILKNETEAVYDKTISAGNLMAGEVRKQVSYAKEQAIEVNNKIKTEVQNKVTSKIVKMLEKIGRAVAGFFINIIIIFKTIFYWTESFFSFKFLPPMAWPKQLAIFILLGAILILPLKVFSYFNIFTDIKGRVLGESEEAIISLQQAADAGGNFNFLGAASHFSQAADNFNEAQLVLTNYSNLITIANILPSKKAKLAATGRSLLMSGEIASEIGENLALAVGSLELDNPDTAKPLTTRLKEFSYYTNIVQEKLNEFEKNISEVDEDVISALKINNQDKIIEQLKLLKTQVKIFKTGLNELAGLSGIMPIFLGDTADKRYLLIFQNNAEMRASGGFIGSYALVDFRQGEIKSIEVPGGGSYDLQGGLHKRVSSPEPLHLVSSLWEFQDSNWWPDWPTSAAKIQWFFENGWGSSVDGVIAIDTTFAERLLSIIGPIDMREKYGEIITSDNFYDVVQSQAERKDTDTPKEIINDLANTLMAELPNRITSNNFFTIIKEIELLFLEKHILLNFNDEELQKFVINHGWEGEIKNTAGDYLSVVNTNIAGGKSDRKIRQAIEHTAEVMPDGSIIDTVIITRHHNGQKGEQYTGVRNVNYLRVYVPAGSELLEASGFSEPDAIFFDEPAEGAEIDPDIHFTENIAKIDEASGVKIYSEFNKTVFGHWTQVDPGQTINIRIKYKLPFKINSISENNSFFTSLIKGDEIINPYSLLVQKQAGSIETAFLGKLVLPSNMKIEWGTDDIIKNNGWEIKDSLTQDKLWGVLVKKL